ncbi:tetratricopeptide repeat protein [Kordia sp.]|uniref:tetratricopeptide repeat protein n=1 Tax=Kordia sp. TaxID=1965332 RepID=UPI003D282E7A
MSFDDQTYAQIASYLNNQMDETAKKAFETLLQSDAELASFLETYKTLEGVYNEAKWTVTTTASVEEIKELAQQFRAADVVDVSTKIRAIQQENRVQKSPKKKTYFYYISSAIAVAAICTLFYFSFMQSLSPNDAFEQYHNWSTLPSFKDKGIANTTKANLIKAETLFTQENYKEALALFSSTTNNQVYNPKAVLYIGVSQLELQQYSEAIQTFHQLKNSDAIDNHKAYWYLTLVYLKQNDAEKAKQTLEILVQNPANYNFDKAQKLLKKLK